MGLFTKWRVLASLFTVATVVYAARTKRSHGTFLGVPFEFRVPTVRRLRDRWWNPGDPRIVTPHVLGIGWSLNVYQLLRRVGYIEEDADESGAPHDRVD